MTEKTARPADGETLVEGLPCLPPPAPPVPQGLPQEGARQDGLPQAPSRPPRRALRAVARWAAAVLVLGGLGTGTAAGITSISRTDVPGLATEDDGRWDYPRLTLPALPANAPRPFSDVNAAEVHHADLRRLLLPAPAGAKTDAKADGWVTTAQYVSEYPKGDRAALTQRLKDSALRHIAARAWTMPDGTSARVYLLQFNSVAFSTEFQDQLFGDDQQLFRKNVYPQPLAGINDIATDDDWPATGGVEYTTTRVFTEAKPYGQEQVRHAYVLAGDTVALVVHARKGAAGTDAVPFHQTLILQNQLLG